MGRKKMTSQDKARKTTSGNRNRKVVIANKSFDKNLFRLLGTKDIIHSDEKFFRSIVKKIDEKVIEKIGAQLANYTKDLESGSHRDKAELVLNVIYGLNLNEDEKKHWSMLRSK